MPALHLTIKPVSSNCNLRCKYCFYHDLSYCRETPSRGLMHSDSLESIMEKAFNYADGSLITVCFQGGEPLLAGKDFYRCFSNIIATKNTKRSAVHVSVETNGVLIDQEWCDIFAKNRYLVGISIDGDSVTNYLRVDTKGNPTFEKTYSAIKLLQERKIDFNIITVVTKPVVENISRVYSFYRKNKFKHLHFIPCLKPIEAHNVDTPEAFYRYGDTEESVDNEDFYITSQEYCEFLKKTFSLYMRDYIDGRHTSIRIFDNFLRLAHSQKAELCGMNGYCTSQFVVEADGETYPCQLYCTDNYSLGNIFETDFSALEKSPKAKAFLDESLGIDEKCKDCNYYRLCKNGCKRERISFDKCSAYKDFFPYALPLLKRMK